MVVTYRRSWQPWWPLHLKKVIINNIVYYKNFYYYLMPLRGYLRREYLLAHLSVPEAGNKNAFKC